MTIAYDLRYADGHFTGIGTHAYALLDALLALPGDDRYTVLWNPDGRRGRYDLEPIRRHPRVTWAEQRIAPMHPAGVFAVGAWLRDVRPAVYYSPFYLNPVGAPCPTLLTIHDVWPLRMPEGLSRVKHVLYRSSLSLAKRARFIVTSSAFSRDEIIACMGADPARVRAVRLGVPPPLPRSETRRPASQPDGAFALVVGDNRPRKNLAVLAGAWASFGDLPPLRLVSAGPVDARYPGLAALAQKAGARGVTELGWMEETELDWLYANASAVLFPTTYEGFGFPLVEAFARGLPVIAADIAVLREIGDGVAEFVDPADASAWAERVHALAEDAEARAQAATRGRERAAELSYRQTAEAMLDLFREAVRPAAGTPA